jgi:hypothetical protein
MEVAVRQMADMGGPEAVRDPGEFEVRLVPTRNPGKFMVSR